MKKNRRKLIKEFRIEKILKRKGDKLYIKWKAYHNSFNSWINKKDILLKMSEYFAKPSSHEENIKAKIDLTNYATQEDIKNVYHLNASNFALITINLSSLKTEVDKLDIDKLVSTPVDFSKLSNVVKNENC